jgi:hypothetical protein
VDLVFSHCRVVPSFSRALRDFTILLTGDQWPGEKGMERQKGSEAFFSSKGIHRL